MRIFLFLLITAYSICSIAQTEEDNIRAQARKFSAHMMAGEKDKLVEMYTSDAKIFPGDRDILEGDDLANYWNPANSNSTWKTTFHKLIPVEIKIWGNEAYDYGYYEGISSNGDQASNWRGKYVVIWRKEDGEWKMYLDIWNRIEDNE